MNIKFMENPSTKITYIYGLYEVGKEDEIRYVGKSEWIDWYDWLGKDK